MATFVIIQTKGDSRFDKKLPERFGNKSFPLRKGGWLVAYDGTSLQLSDELGISEDRENTAIVFRFTGYWGRANNAIWEWIAENGDNR